jgi:SAM-dependent methyltransferase
MTTHPTPTVADRHVRYAFSNSVREAAQQLAALQTYLDPITTGVLDHIDIPTGARCLELGPGGGSIAHWLAQRVGPAGSVLAVDQDPSQLALAANLEVRQHDLQLGLPTDLAGPFQLIHARLVLVHLPNRHQLLRQLVDVLAPGGWIVLGEFSRHPLRVLTARSDDDAELFTTVIDTFTDLLITRHGADTDWAHQVHPTMAHLGLRHLKTIEHAESWTGGESGSQLHQANISQMTDRLLAAGLTPAQLTRFDHLMTDPQFSARSWQFVCTRGQKPAGNQ